RSGRAIWYAARREAGRVCCSCGTSPCVSYYLDFGEDITCLGGESRHVAFCLGLWPGGGGPASRGPGIGRSGAWGRGPGAEGGGGGVGAGGRGGEGAEGRRNQGDGEEPERSRRETSKLSTGHDRMSRGRSPDGYGPAHACRDRCHRRVRLLLVPRRRRG